MQYLLAVIFLLEFVTSNQKKHTRASENTQIHATQVHENEGFTEICINIVNRVLWIESFTFVVSSMYMKGSEIIITNRMVMKVHTFVKYENINI